MQLSSFSNNNFFLGHSAMLVNEGLPDYIVGVMKQKYDLKHLKVGILGMAFKGDNDDPRESLSYKLKKKMQFEAESVFCHDPYVNDSRLVSIEKIRKEADVIVIATPHSDYKNETWDDKIVIDMWNIYGNGGVI
jgi:UDP-N-acetyl-D-mannosaminuronic acid dehydrogenase